MRKITAAVSSPSRSLSTPTKTMTDPASHLYRAVAEGRSVDEVCAAVEACAPPGPVTRSSNSRWVAALDRVERNNSRGETPLQGVRGGANGRRVWVTLREHTHYRAHNDVACFFLSQKREKRNPSSSQQQAPPIQTPIFSSYDDLSEDDVDEDTNAS
jgi:hypothetical protein